jgi:malate dehydrogenase (oxaloacetate-decarboxylating)(NADP+)
MEIVMPFAKRGVELLEDPHLSRSTAFTESEREALGLVGPLPEVVETEGRQLQRVLETVGEARGDEPKDLQSPLYHPEY